MKRTVLILAFIVSLPVIQLHAQDQDGKESEKAMREVVEEAKKNAIDEAKAKREAGIESGANRDFGSPFGFDRRGGFPYSEADKEKAWATAKENMDSVRVVWEEAIKRGQDSFPDYWEDYAETYRMAFEEARKEFAEINKEWNNKSPFPMKAPMDNDRSIPFMTQVKHTDWNISRSLIEDTFVTAYSFEVTDETKNVSIAISGNCWIGTISIKAYAPNGAFVDLAIDEFGNLNWRKNFAITDTKYTEKRGLWKFEVNAYEATGYFKISIQTY